MMNNKSTEICVNSFQDSVHYLTKTKVTMMDSALPRDETVKTSGLKSQTSAEKRDQSMPPGWACSGKKQQLLLDRKGWMAASERNSFSQFICERQLITIIWSTSLPLASLIDIIKPLFTVLSSASINLGNIKRKIVVSTENQTLAAE